MVSNHADITWKKAADATGITYDNLRKSLLAIRKTPVVRFLTACEAFGIDPFTILIDPNPEQRHRKRAAVPAGSPTDNDESIRADIRVLTKQLADLNTAVSDITARYDDLLKRHTALLDRYNELERRFYDYSGPSSSMAADQGA